MAIIIDPPVGPFSPEPDILAWIEHLQRMLKTAQPKNVFTIDQAIRTAQRWLELQRAQRTDQDL